MYKLYVTNTNTLKELVSIYRKWNYFLITYTDNFAEMEKDNAEMIRIELYRRRAK